MNNIKNAIIDGYFKTFDLFGAVPIGKQKYLKMTSEQITEYYKFFGGTMIITFGMVIGNILLLAYSIQPDTWVNTVYVLITYFIIMSPLLWQLIIGIKDLIYEF